MGNINNTPYFFQSKPIFGLDIGVGSLKVVQLDLSSHSNSKRPKEPATVAKPALIGYGVGTFDPSAIEDGVVVKPELVAAAAQSLFQKQLIGDVTTNRVAMAIPAYRTFTRSIQLPALKPKERAEAVLLEAEQYLPMPLEDMYMDYTTISESTTGIEVLAVAVPKKIVDSYTALSALMGLEPMLIETTMNAAGRMFSHDGQSDVPTVVIDFGTLSSDISIYDRGIITTGTVEGGGQVFTDAIQKGMGVSNSEAIIIKTKYGLNKSKRQDEIQAILDPILQKIVKEIKRLIRYHGERYGSDRPIQQVITLGGGANIPGLSEYFTSRLRLAVRASDPWQYIDLASMQPPNLPDRSMYATAIGLAFVAPHEAFK